MGCNIFLVVLATIGLVVVVCSNISHAHQPPFSNEPRADNDGGGSGYFIPQFNLHYAPIQHENQDEQNQQQNQNRYPDQKPNLSYFTTTKTSLTASGASSTTSHLSIPLSASLSTISATSTKPSLQAAHVYKANVPTHIEPETNKVLNAVKFYNLSSYSSPSSATSAAGETTTTNSNINSEKDDDLSKKIVGSSVVTSVSVILNGNEPEFTDALGQKVPKPQPSLQVASPIDLLNPDRYEFYTFDENGELVKRLMTMEEIQSIVANGDGEGPTIIHHGPIEDRDPEKNVQDIVNSVQNVLNKEVESNKNTSADNLPTFDTPDVSSSWSMILPAIFGNTGSVHIFPQQKPQQIVMTPDTEIIETSTKESLSTTTKKPKPSKRKPGQKRKPATTTTEMSPQVIQEELNSQESVYTGMQQYQNLAASMQNYDSSFSQLHMQPIYHKLPAIETSTRRVFINNQEVVRKPVSDDENGESNLNENLAKKPVSVHHKPQSPHRVKKPNGVHTTTKRTQTNKQKIKKKPTSTIPESSMTITTPVPVTTTTYTPTTTSATPEPTTTTTTLEPTITTTTPANITTTTSTSPPTAASNTTHTSTSEASLTTKAPKKKKKKPTRHPVHSSTTILDDSIEKPHFSDENRKPSPKPDRQRPKPQQHTKSPHVTTPSDLAAEGSAHQEVSHNKFQHVSYHRPRPKPVKPLTTTATTTPELSTTTAVFSPTIATSTNDPTSVSLIVQDFAGLQQSSNNYYGEALLTARTTTMQPDTSTSANVPTSGTSGYPVPSYSILTSESVKEDIGFNQYKKQPLPSFSITRNKTKPYDVHTLQSYDQIIQTLKQPEEQLSKKKEGEKLNLKPVQNHSEEFMSQRDSINSKPSFTTNYGDSTLATNLPDIETSTDFTSLLQTTVSTENISPEVTITPQSQNHAMSKIPEEFTTDLPTEVQTLKDIETVELPSYTPFIHETDKSSIVAELPETTNIFIEKENEKTTSYPIVKENNDEDHTEDFEIPAYGLSSIKTEHTAILNGEENYANESQTTEDSTEAFTIETRLPVFIEFESKDNDEKDINRPILVADLKPQLNLEVIKPSEQITMFDFQTQAATVASTLVDGSNTISSDYNMINSNQTKDEIAFLMSDVIKQISNTNDMSIIHETNKQNDNRYSNQAHLNLSFLIEPTKKPTIISVPSDNKVEEHQHYKPIFERFENTQNIDHQKENSIQSTIHHISTKAPVLEITTSNKEVIKDTNQTYFISSYDETTTNMYINRLEDLMITNLNSSSDTLIEIITTNTQLQGEDHTEVQTEINEHTIENINEYNQETSTEKISNPDESENTYITSTISSEDKNTTYHIIIDTTQNITAMPSSAYSDTYFHKEKLQIEREPLFEAGSSVDTTTKINVLSEETTLLPNDNYKDESEGNNKISEHILNMSSENNSKYETTTITNYMEEDTSMTTEISTESRSEESINISEVENYTHVAEHTDAIEITTSEDNESIITDANIHHVNPEIVIENSTESHEQNDLSKSDTHVLASNENKDAEVTSAKIEESLEVEESTVSVFQMSEETSDELNAMISEEDETNEPIDEDSYIKLGETTTQKSEQHLESETQIIIQSTTNESPTEKESPMLDPPKPIDLIVENDSPTGIQENIEAYGHPEDEADEEDEDDQFGYQIPKLPISVSSSSTMATSSATTTSKPKITTTRRLNTLKPVSYFNKQPVYALYQDSVEPLYNKQQSSQSFNKHQNENSPSKVVTYSIPTPQQRPMQRPPQLSNLMISSTQATRSPVKLEPSPSNSKGLEESLVNLDEDILSFAKLCNELAFSYWKSITSEKISSARSLVMSPFALTSMLSMVFLGARGSTSGEMNDILKLDDMVTFNPHLVFKNITDSVEKAMDSDIATTAFVREIFSNRANGKILQFFKEKTQQLYAGHVEEVNFHVVNDIIRRRTNLLVKRHTMGKVLEYLRTNSVWVNGPLATISANLFQTDCSHGSIQDRDGEIFFQVHPTVRQRRLVPIPAVLFKSGFTAGYEPNLDATVVAFGRIQDTTSMIYIMPGHMSLISPSDNLDRLEKQLAETAISKNAWSNLLTSLMDRPGVEVQLPRFSHRSFVNATLGLQKMGLKGLFKSDYADLGGLTGSSNRDIYLSDMIQINTFSTCGEEKIADHHHVEMYPAPPLRKRNKDVDIHDNGEQDSSEAIIDFGSLVQDSVLGRGFYDDLLDPKYLELPLPLRPRQARVPDAPRLRFDKPFLYFVRHNPTGMILFMGRFNPRLLP